MTLALVMHRLPLFGRLGTCGRCLRKAFVASGATWGLALSVMLFGSEYSTGLVALLVAAIILTLLWIAHLIAFARRTTMRSDSRHGLPVPSFVFAQAMMTAASASVKIRPLDSDCGGFNGECDDPCMRQTAPGIENCEYCHSCGEDCPQDNEC
jgi:hypothetical protein